MKTDSRRGGRKQTRVAVFRKAASLKALLCAGLAAALLPGAAPAGAGDGFGPGTIRLRHIPGDAPRFEDHPAGPVYTGRPAAPDLRSHSRSRAFRTALRRGAAQPADFAGHYRLVRWGCGSGCLAFAIVDLKSGAVYHPAGFDTFIFENDSDFEGFTGRYGALFAYRPDSRLLVAVGSFNEDPKQRGLSYFVWEAPRLKRIRFVPVPRA